MLVTVLSDPADGAKLQPLITQDWGTERLAVSGRAAYLWCPDGLAESRLADVTARLLRDTATTRNWATILKLHALVEDSA
jgi:uncharacterized protein (DUF1697 family)